MLVIQSKSHFLKLNTNLIPIYCISWDVIPPGCFRIGFQRLLWGSSDYKYFYLSLMYIGNCFLFKGVLYNNLTLLKKGCSAGDYIRSKV